MISYTIDPLMRKDILNFLEEIEKKISFDKFCKVKMILDEALEKKAITSQDIDRIDQIIHSEKMDTTTEIAEQKKNKSVSENKVTFNWNPDNCSFISMLSEVNDYSFEKVFAFHTLKKRNIKRSR